MKTFLLLLCACALLLASCDSGTDSSNTVELFPLKIGNQWLYQETDYDTTGTVVQSDDDTVFVERDTIVAGQTWYFLNQDEDAMYRNASDGIYLWIRYLVDTSHPVRWFKHPTSEGEISYRTSDTSSLYIFTTTIVAGSLDTSILTPAGQFRCISYRSANTVTEIATGMTISEPDYDKFYWSPGVGLVANHGFRTTDSGRLYLNRRYELKSRSLK